MAETNGDTTEAIVEIAQKTLGRMQSHSESINILFDKLVDPNTPFFDDGERWERIGGENDRHARGSVRTEQDLRNRRQHCRLLAEENEFAINGHENRVSYVIGEGHQYQLQEKEEGSFPENVLDEARRVLDEFLEANKWCQRQQEGLMRFDRDGEVFYRLFEGTDGLLRVRFVEPGQVSTPQSQVNNPHATFGILTDSQDVENVFGYWIDDELIDAGEIQHRKANVDLNVKRGQPLFWPVRKGLARAEKILRNMGTLTEIQTAIALIRKHTTANKQAIENFVSGVKALSKERTIDGKTISVQQFEPGSIVDAGSNIEYEFPGHSVNSAGFVQVLQAELRAVASRLVMPEFMLTSDASNANFASTMVAEGPAVKMFLRLQARVEEDDHEIILRQLRLAEERGRLPVGVSDQLDIVTESPSVATRDRKQEADVRQILRNNQILSPQTWAGMEGLDYEQEQMNLDEHAERTGDRMPSVTMPFGAGMDQGEDEESEDDGDG